MLDDAQFRKLLDTRARHPERVAEAAKARRRRPVLNETGRLFLVAADHPARGIVKAGAVYVPLDPQAPFIPTLYLYDAFPGGVSLSAPLFERRGELVDRARELIRQCDCRLGCPACVGPVLASDETAARSMKELGAAVLDLLADL